MNAEYRVPSLKASRAASAIAGLFALKAEIAPPALTTTVSTSWLCTVAARAGLNSESRASNEEPNEVNSTVPRIAMPSADPICRAVLAVPEPWPLLSMGASLRTTPVSCAVARATPNPVHEQDGRDCQPGGGGGDDGSESDDADDFGDDAEADDRDGRDFRKEHTGQSACGEGADCQGKEHESGLQGTVVPHVLQPQWQ